MNVYLERFDDKWVKCPMMGCWIWCASLNKDGYGWFRSVTGMVRAHRWSYEHFVGPIPEGLEIDHLCKERSCVRPDHLEAVTHAENVRRGDSGIHFWSRTHCKNGHEFTDANTYREVRRPTYRRCRECNRLNEQARRDRKKDEK